MKKLIIGILIIVLFYVMCAKNLDIISYEEYEHLSEISKIKETRNNIFFFNYYLPNIFLAKFQNTKLMLKILLLIFFILNIILIENILDLLKKDATLFIILSPSFLYIHLIYNKVFIALFFYLVAIYLLLKDKYFFSFLSSILCLMFNPYFFLILILSFSVIYYLMHKKNIFSILIILFTTYIFSLSKNYMPFLIISDFGYNLGISIFLIILGLMGLVFSWKQKNYIIYIAIIAIYIATLYENSMAVFLNFIFAYYAALSFEKIRDKKWESHLLKNYVILLIYCGLIFSSFSFLNNLNKSLPSEAEITSFRWLKSYSENNYGILSDYKYGSSFDYYGLIPYTDLRYYLFSSRTKINETNAVFKSRNLKNIIDFMEKNSIKYIWINEKMKSEIWEKDDDGILLLLRTSPSFKKIFNYKGVEIWEIQSR